MKKLTKIFLTTIFLLVSIYSNLNAQTVEWLNGCGGSSGTDKGKGVAADGAGNIYNIGSFATAGIFGTFSLTAFGNSDFDAFLTKTDPTGGVLWAKQFGGTGTDAGGIITIDGSNNIFIAGSFNGTATFGTFSLTSVGSNNAFLCKMDVSGNVLWAKQFSGTNIVGITGISVDPSGNICIAGSFNGTAAFGSYTLSSSNDDAFIAKLDASGNAMWANKMGGTGFDTATGVTCDGSSNVYVTGNFSGTGTFSPYTLTSAGGNDAFIAKVNSTGFLLWAKQFGGTGNDLGKGIAVNSSGNIYASGDFTAPSSFGTFILNSGTSYILQLDGSGVVQWVNQFGGVSAGDATTVFGLVADPGGNIYTTGSFIGTCTFGTNTVVAAVLTSNPGANEAFISKLNPAGNFLWVKQLGGTNSSNYGYGITYYSGKTYTSGKFRGTLTSDSYSISTFGGGGTTNAFLVKVSADPVGIRENINNLNLSVYPNPVNDKLFIEADEFNKELNLCLLDIMGREILNKKFANKETLSLSQLSKGMYFLKIGVDGQNVIRKIIKE